MNVKHFIIYIIIFLILFLIIGFVILPGVIAIHDSAMYHLSLTGSFSVVDVFSYMRYIFLLFTLLIAIISLLIFLSKKKFNKILLLCFVVLYLLGVLLHFHRYFIIYSINHSINFSYFIFYLIAFFSIAPFIVFLIKYNKVNKK